MSNDNEFTSDLMQQQAGNQNSFTQPPSYGGKGKGTGMRPQAAEVPIPSSPEVDPSYGDGPQTYISPETHTSTSSFVEVNNTQNPTMVAPIGPSNIESSQPTQQIPGVPKSWSPTLRTENVTTPSKAGTTGVAAQLTEPSVRPTGAPSVDSSQASNMRSPSSVQIGSSFTMAQLTQLIDNRLSQTNIYR